ncbi:hypothetical protein [Streptosporangium sp. V21-05]|uniref:hypothetical protein n=1 Tax=Streptosporangium sp. V21-05 TaxID=3446115 RepID=UPI003F530386
MGTLAVSGQWVGSTVGVDVTANQALLPTQWSVTFANSGLLTPTVTVSSTCVGPA